MKVMFWDLVALVVVTVVTVRFSSFCDGRMQFTAGLEYTNKLREKHCAQPLKINENLTKLACECAKYYLHLGKIDHSCPYKSKYGKNPPGENLYQTIKQGSRALQLDGDAMFQNATEAWYGELKDYDFKKPSHFKGVVGHFTQLVWRSTKEMGGCIRIHKNKKESNCKAVVVVLYDEGNVLMDKSSGEKGGSQEEYSLYLNNVLSEDCKKLSKLPQMDR